MERPIAAPEEHATSGGWSPELVLARMVQTGRSLGIAESLTGGLLSSTLVSVPGASAVVRGAAVTYATDTKASVLGVDTRLLSDRGAVDPEVATAMAVGAARLFTADLGVSTTGVAGPDGQAGVDVGTVFVAVVDAARGISVVRGVTLGGSRTEIRQQTVALALEMLAGVLTEPQPL